MASSSPRRRLSRLGGHVNVVAAGDAVGNDGSSLGSGASSPGGAAVSEEIASFRENGFVLVNGLLASAPLFLRAQAAYQSLRPGFVQMFGPGSQVLNCPGALERDPAFVALLEAPELLPLMAGTVGDDVQIREVAVQAYPPQTPEKVSSSGGYTGWHRDRPQCECELTMVPVFRPLAVPDFR
jgi:hypothetical protein